MPIAVTPAMATLPSTRVTLLARLRDPADAEAWEEFVSIYEPAILSAARRWGLQHADAGDLAQAVLVAVAGRAGDWRPRHARGSFRGWLRTVTRNQLANAARSLHRRHVTTGSAADWRVVPEPVADLDIFDLEVRRETFRRAADAIRGLFAPRTWQAFWLATVDDVPAADVARRLGMSVGAVYIAKSRVLARLRDEVARLDVAAEG